MPTSSDFKAGYDAASKAKQLIVDALEAQNAELRAALDECERQFQEKVGAIGLGIDRELELLRKIEALVMDRERPEPWHEVAICQPHVGEPWVWEP